MCIDPEMRTQIDHQLHLLADSGRVWNTPGQARLAVWIAIDEVAGCSSRLAGR